MLKELLEWLPCTHVSASLWGPVTRWCIWTVSVVFRHHYGLVTLEGPDHVTRLFGELHQTVVPQTWERMLAKHG